MSVQPTSLQAAFALARQAGFSHAMLVVDRGDVPSYALTRVANWQIMPEAKGARENRVEMVALYDLRDAAAPRWCYQPQLLKPLRDGFACALTMPDVLAQTGLARIVARPVTAAAPAHNKNNSLPQNGPVEKRKPTDEKNSCALGGSLRPDRGAGRFRADA